MVFVKTSHDIQNASSMCTYYQRKKSFNIMNVMFFIVTANTLDNNQNITFVIFKDFFFTL